MSEYVQHKLTKPSAHGSHKAVNFLWINYAEKVLG